MIFSTESKHRSTIGLNLEDLRTPFARPTLSGGTHQALDRMSTELKTRLLVLGGASLEGARGPIAGRAAQRRRLALLAILAVSRRGVSRDKLIGYLWEEADSERARRVLSEAIYVLRKSLGEDAILTVGDEIRLNPDVVWSDVGAFLDHIDAGEREQAVALYAGPFLDGFFLSDALEFEQWADRERDRLARVYAQACKQLGEQCESAGDFTGSVTWWRRLVEHDKYGAAPTLSLMRALDAVGDRAAAIQEARAHAARMKADLDAEPDTQVEAFAQALRESGPAAELPARAVEPIAHLPPTAVLPTATPTVPVILARRRVKKRYIAAGALTVLAAAAFAISLVTSARNETGTAAGKTVLAVMPLEVNGGDAEWRAGLASLLSSNLNGVGQLQTADSYQLLSAAEKRFGDRAIAPREAAQFATRIAGADYVLLGNVIQAGSTVTLKATIYDARDPTKVAVPEVVERNLTDSVHVLVDAVSRQLLAGLGQDASAELQRAALLTSDSMKALKAFWNGDEHFRASRYRDAVASFSEAVAIDKDFALAHYRLSTAAEWNFEFQLAQSEAEMASSLAERLRPPEQWILPAWNAFLNGNIEAARSLYSRVLNRSPENIEAIAGIAEVLVHYNAQRGDDIREAKRHFERVMDKADYGEARFHLMEFAARDGNRVALDSLFAGLQRHNPQYLVWKAVRAARFGTPAEWRAVLTELDTASSETLGLAAARIAAHTHKFTEAEQVAMRITRNPDSSDWKAVGYLLAAQIAIANGDWAGAKQHLSAAEPLERDWTRELSALFLLHPDARATKADFEAELKKLRDWTPRGQKTSTQFFLATHALVHPEIRQYLIALLSIKAGDFRGAEQARNDLYALGGAAEKELLAVALGRSIEGHTALARNNQAEAIRILENIELRARPELLAFPFYARTYDRFVLARVTGAERWRRSITDSFDFAWARAVTR